MSKKQMNEFAKKKKLPQHKNSIRSMMNGDVAVVRKVSRKVNY